MKYINPLEKHKILIKEYQTVFLSASIVDIGNAYSKSTKRNLKYLNWKNICLNYWSHGGKICLCFRHHTLSGHVIIIDIGLLFVVQS